MADSPATTRTRLLAGGYRQALLVLGGGILLSLGLSLWTAAQVDQQVQERFNRLAAQQVEAIEQRLAIYAYGLRGARGIFGQDSERVDAPAFRAYNQSRDLPREFPGAVSWGFAERLPADAGALVPHLARHGVNRYWRLDDLSGPTPGQDAWVVRLVEPVEGNPLPGLDLASEPRRQAAALEAMKSGRPTLSALIELPERQGQPGFLLVLPVYGSGIAHPGNVSGWVYVSLLKSEVFAFLGTVPALADRVELDVLDISAGAAQPLFSLAASSAEAREARRLRRPPTLQMVRDISVGGRQWQVRLSGRPALYSGAERWLPPLALAIGTLLSLMVSGLFGLNSLRRGEAEERARRMTTSLREREAVLESTLASLDDWVFVLDAEGRVLDCHEPLHNQGWKARSEFIGQPLAAALPPAAQAELGNALREIRTHLHTHFDFSLHGVGRSRHFSARLSARRHADGSIDGATLVARDVSREREQAREMRESEEKFRRVFEEAAQAILILRQDRYVDANPAALRLFGIPNLSALQHSAMGMLSPVTQPDGQPSLEALGRHLKASIEDGAQHFDWTFRRLSNGEQFPGEVHISCVELDGEPHFLALITDLSARKQTELALIQARDAAEEATREKSEFLATMSHEIRTPMNGVLGMAQLLAQGELNTEQRDYLHTIQQSGHALLAIINDILDFSKIEVGKLSFEEVPFDLQVAIDETCELLLPQIREKNLTLTLELDPSTPFHVIGDPGRFRQILLNYLSNALKFTQQGGITVSLRARERGRGAVLYEMSVADTGIGIDPEKQTQLFERFTQAETTHARRFGGTGLGLAICKALVERMGGRVSMASMPGHGSTFRATFWLTLDPDAGHQMLPALLPPLRGAPVLVIDDNAANRELLVKGLARAGLAVYGAGSVAEAVLAVQRQAPRFVLLDAELPDGNAETLITALRAEPALGDAAMLLLSSRPDSNDHAFCRAHGIAAYLPKPARLGWLVSAINLLSGGSHDGLVTRHTLASAHLRGKTLPPLRPGIRVLLVEDNAVNQKVAARMLEKMGCHVDMAGNGLEALVMAGQLPYDVILMDVQMPEMDGITATRALRAQGFSELPIVALTANSREADRDECRAAGMSDFLAKPIRYEDLHSCLGRWV